MLYKTLLILSKKMIQKKMEEKPDGGFKTPEGRVSYAEAIEALDKHIGWLYPAMDSGEFVKIVRCPKCLWYSEEKVVDGYQKKVVKKCSMGILNEDVTTEKFFCAKAEERIELRKELEDAAD